MSKILYCTSGLKGEEGHYLIHCYEGDNKSFELMGSESFTKKERISLIALRDAVLSIQEEGGVIYTDSDYAYDCIQGGDHRKNKDVYHVLKSAMSKRIQVAMVNKSQKRYKTLVKQMEKIVSLS